MNIQKKQILKKPSFISFSLLSLLFLSESQGRAMSTLGQSDSEGYREIHNRIAATYKLNHHIFPLKVSPYISGVGQAEQFNLSAAALRRQTEEQKAEINALGRAAAEGAGAVAQNIVENNIKDEKAKSGLLRLKDKVVSFFKSLF